MIAIGIARIITSKIVDAVTFLRGSRRITRTEGAILVTGYLAFVVAAALW